MYIPKDPLCCIIRVISISKCKERDQSVKNGNILLHNIIFLGIWHLYKFCDIGVLISQYTNSIFSDN